MNIPVGWQARQGGLGQIVAIEGRGLHTGHRVHVRILPVDDGSGCNGIRFYRMRNGHAIAAIAVDPARRHAQPLCTMLRNENGVGVRTVEHLLAALLACEIDHARVELDAEELPILDGSAAPWIAAIRAGGRRSLALPKRFLRVTRPISVADGARHDRRELRIEPADRYEVSVSNELKYFGAMRWEGVVTPATFASEIASSRSYGRVAWALPAILAGYARGVPVLRGARPSCTAAIVGGRVLGGLRMPDEPVRHRVLDLIGDLALAGAPLLGRVTALRPSHEMNHRLVTKLLASRDAWEWA